MSFSPLLLLLFNAVVLVLLLQASWARAIQTRSLAMAPAPNKRLVAGPYHFNYLQDNGQVFSWGYTLGLGAGDIPDSAFPVPMLDVSAASDVSAGWEHTCVVDGGAAKCCGRGIRGQLGNGTNANSFTLVQVQGLTAGVKQVVASYLHSCAILDSGGMRCWGNNIDGQLGDGSNVNTNVFVPVTNYEDSGVHSACAGVWHTCILTTAGAALCTGSGFWGQLGNGGTTEKSVMTEVTGLTSGTVTQISCGGHHTCAMTSAGGLACFGYNADGALGFDYESDQLTPVYPVGLQAGVITVVTGWDSTCVIDNPASMARCFGWQYSGEFANPNTTRRQTSPAVFGGGITGIVEIAVGFEAICILDQLGRVQCVGDNGSKQLGSGSEMLYYRHTLDYVIGFPVTSAPTSSPTVPTLAPTSSPIVPTLAPTSSPIVPTLAPTTSTPTTFAPTTTTTSGANLLHQPAAGYAALLLAAMLA